MPPEEIAPTATADEVALWASLVFPDRLEPHERLCCHRYWKPSWPTKAPDGREAWAADMFRDVDDLCGAVRGRYAGYNIGISVGVLDGRVPGGRVKRAFARTRTLAVDLDCGAGKEFARPNDALSALQSFRDQTGIGPGVILSTGTGLHAFYLLEQCCTDGEEVEATLRGLVLKLGADPAAVDRLRIMRVPGTFNYKYAPPVRVAVIEATGQRHRLEDVQLHAPPPPRTRTARSASTGVLKPLNVTDGTVISRPPVSVAPLLRGELPARYNGDESRRDFFVACELLKGNNSPADVVKTMAESDLGGQAQRRKPDPEYYLQVTVENALAAVQKNVRRPSRQAIPRGQKRVRR